MVVFAKTTCVFCKMLKQKLSLMKVEACFVEVDKIMNGQETFEKLKKLNGKNTVPQIYIDKRFIGGYDDFEALQKENKLVEIFSKANISYNVGVVNVSWSPNTSTAEVSNKTSFYFGVFKMFGMVPLMIGLTGATFATAYFYKISSAISLGSYLMQSKFMTLTAFFPAFILGMIFNFKVLMKDTSISTVGSKLPDLPIIKLDGKKTTLGEFSKQDRPLVLNLGSFS
jgi:glutaredoxin 3